MILSKNKFDSKINSTSKKEMSLKTWQKKNKKCFEY